MTVVFKGLVVVVLTGFVTVVFEGFVAVFLGWTIFVVFGNRMQPAPLHCFFGVVF